MLPGVRAAQTALQVDRQEPLPSTCGLLGGEDWAIFLDFPDDILDFLDEVLDLQDFHTISLCITLPLQQGETGSLLCLQKAILFFRS